MHCQPLETRTEVEVPESISTEYIPLPIVESLDESESLEEDPELAKPDAEESSSEDEPSSSDDDSLPEPSEGTPNTLEPPTDETSYREFPRLPWEQEANDSSEALVTNALHQLLQPSKQEEISTDSEENILLTNPSHQVVFRDEAVPPKLLPPVEQIEAFVQQHSVPIYEAIPSQMLPPEIFSNQGLEPKVNDPVKKVIKKDTLVRLVQTKSADPLATERPASAKLGTPPKESPIDSVGKTSKTGPLRFQAGKTSSANPTKPRNPASMFVR